MKSPGLALPFLLLAAYDAFPAQDARLFGMWSGKGRTYYGGLSDSLSHVVEFFFSPSAVEFRYLEESDFADTGRNYTYYQNLFGTWETVGDTALIHMDSAYNVHDGVGKWVVYDTGAVSNRRFVFEGGSEDKMNLTTCFVVYGCIGKSFLLEKTGATKDFKLPHGSLSIHSAFQERKRREGRRFMGNFEWRNESFDCRGRKRAFAQWMGLLAERTRR